MKQLVYIVGAPGCGKSTAMRRATSWLDRVPLPGSPGREALVNRRSVAQAIELGVTRKNFSGTDALPMGVNPVACNYLARPEAPTILGEGSRLANARFLSSAVANGFAVTLIHLDNPNADEWRAARAKRLGAEQNASWVKGRDTAARRLANYPPKGVGVLTVYDPGEAAVAIQQIVEWEE